MKPIIAPMINCNKVCSLYKCLMNIGQLILSALIGIVYGYFYYKYTIPYVYNKTYSKEDNNLIITDRNKNLKCIIPEKSH